MSPNWLGLTSAVLATAAFILTHRLARPLPLSRRRWLTLAALILAAPGATFAAYYTHHLPEPAWYYEFRSWPGTELLVIPLGVAGGFLATLLPTLSRALPYTITFAFAFVPWLKPIVAPLPRDTLHDRWRGPICMQSTYSTCGPASMVTALHQLGLTESESTLAREAHTYLGGTEAWYLARAARRRGFHVQFHTGAPPPNADLPLPAIAGVRLRHFGHFIPILARKDHLFHIGDPTMGGEWLTLQDLQTRYQFTGFYMTIRRE